MLKLKSIKSSSLILAVHFFTHTVLAQDFLQENVEIRAYDSQIENLKQEKSINRSLFLPELALKIGVGSEKLKDFNYESDTGPFTFLEGKLNLYRGGKDSITTQRTNVQITSAQLEKEIKLRELRIELSKKQNAIFLLDKKNALIERELKESNGQSGMARKKVNAGLTTSVDLLDFELKNKLLANEIEKNNIEKEQILSEIGILKGKKLFASEMTGELNDKLQLTLLNIETSPKFELAKRRLEISKMDQQNAKGDYLPSVDLEARWGQITPQKTFWKEEREHQVALSLTIPLFSGFSTQGKVQQTLIDVSQKERELNQAQLEQVTQLDIGKRKVELLKRNVAVLEATLAQAQRYKDFTIAEYKRGIKNSPDVISASDKNFELEQKLIETKFELYNEIYALNETFKTYKEE
jgi:outer membrane protein